MLTEQDASDLIRLEFPETAAVEKFTGRLEVLAQKTDEMLSFPATGKTDGVLRLINYLFVHGSKYVRIQLIDHYFKLLKKVKCKLSLGEGENEQKTVSLAEECKFSIHYRWRCARQYSRLTLITIRS
ncbi:hypothetical protein [Sinomicrobium weinanense]|uniref:Uncharacterized protein n=1 Tax=Sinomicrobium weinanense TaxID=2842200 RepID=A0A926JU53_9FLAO|nr:hypothetical protein [Sinomicrobium weinanense]MBC9797241.1 hypothetical protein [Sinomicrobium weinanense]MBU3122357.1 hypothetical protein [Sinomicrobium weinanense]